MAEQNLLERTKMRMLRWMMGIKRIEKMRSWAGVANMSKKIREARLRWSGHLERKTEDEVVMRTWKIEVSGFRMVGRKKLRWSDVIKRYMKEKGVKREEAQDRRTWRLKTRCIDPK